VTAVMQGIRILEVAEHTFVPASSAILSDWGAEVIKVEPVGRGDAMRNLGRTGVIDLGEGGVHVLLEHSNRGKRSIGLDLATPEGREVLYKLVAVSDVFLTNKLPRVRTALGIDVDDIRTHNPNIVYVRGSGYGQQGPDADRGGYDILGYWCRSGVAAAVRPPDVDGFISQPGPAYGDSLGAMTIAGGISAALLHRERTGEAPIVDVSLLATGMWALGAGIALAKHMGQPWQNATIERTQMNNPLTASYRTKDERWLYFSCLQGFQYWPEICTILGREELITDPRFATHADLIANAMQAGTILSEIFLTQTAAEWRECLSDFRGQWAMVQDVLEVTEDPQVKANGYLVDCETAQGAGFSLVATPVQFDGTSSPAARAPEFNEHGDAILGELLGYDWDTIVDMKVKGAVE
jgi:crotonobetainyl-CoA:carnitine CoA-transferase CaiB-like acyl-CoA transferase